ncbi:hypothetical protein FQZ97_949950 [compost metagenome]
MRDAVREHVDVLVRRHQLVGAPGHALLQVAPELGHVVFGLAARGGIQHHGAGAQKVPIGIQHRVDADLGPEHLVVGTGDVQLQRRTQAPARGHGQVRTEQGAGVRVGQAHEAQEVRGLRGSAVLEAAGIQAQPIDQRVVDVDHAQLCVDGDESAGHPVVQGAGAGGELGRS